MADSMSSKTYRGNCHCGAFVYEIDVPEITSVGECNCSICHRKAYLWVFLRGEHFRAVKGSVGDLTAYTFGRKTMEHKFCPTCGTAIMCKAVGGDISVDNDIAINSRNQARAIQGISSFDLDRKFINGTSAEPIYVPPTHRGPIPNDASDGRKLYTGSCHCGKVTVAARCQPLDETYDEMPIIACNCSICERGGYVWIYPEDENVVLSGDEGDIATYWFGSRAKGKTFCRTCGVHLTNRWDFEKMQAPREDPNAAKEKPKGQGQPAKGQMEKWQALFRASKRHPVNLRVLEGVDLDKLSIIKAQGAKAPPFYVNP